MAAVAKINWNIETRGTGTKKPVADGHHGAGGRSHLGLRGPVGWEEAEAQDTLWRKGLWGW